MRGLFLILAAAAALVDVEGAGAGAARLVCYVESARAESFSECTHLVYTGDARGEKLDALLKDYRNNNPRLKILLRVAEVNKDLRSLLKSKHIQGLEIIDAHKSLNKTKVVDTIEDARKIISSSGGGPLFLALPASPELLAKYYDLRVLVKKVDLMMVQTHALGMVKKMTYHPSRLSGMWDMMNTDSVVDLVIGLGVPASKIVISLPATARQFTLVNETLSTPGSPTLDDEPKEISQVELCRQLQKGRWTLERDQDLSAPYAFKNKTWMSFEDSSSVDVKGKYARVRGLAGLALHQADLDLENACGPTLKSSLGKVLNQQSRAPRAVVLRSLENEILSAPRHQALEALQVSPYRITQVVDSDGVIHSIREDTRTEFSCSRQGYFVHPRSCARFYRCVKFDQLSSEYTVFEFDCPAGLAFDSRYEVCVWPGSLPHSQACPGSSEIAPVPKTRFVCPEHEGYYADPENCRWFFACLDHGSLPLTAYEFRCPFGLGFDAGKLTCDWPWLVPACGNIARYEAEVHGYSGALLSGAAGFQGQTADSVNIAAHNSLVSGAAIHNHVGIQGGFLTKDDALDANFIASQELANQAYQVNGLEAEGLANHGLVQATKYNDGEKYTSGSLILDDYRLPTNKVQDKGINHGSEGKHSNGYAGLSILSQNGESDESGAYVHDPSGDYALPYKHLDLPAEPYQHSGEAYKQSSDYYDYGRYSAQHNYNGQYGNSGQYVYDNSGGYVDGSANSDQYSGKYEEDISGQYNAGYSENLGKFSTNLAKSGAYYETGSSIDGQSLEKYNGDISGQYIADNAGQYYTDNSGAYKDDLGKYVAGVYRADGHIGENAGVINTETYHGSYGNANGNYISDSKAYPGSSHTLTAGAVNVGLVGKTTLVDSNNNEGSYRSSSSNAYNGKSQSYSNNVIHQTGQFGYVSQPAVSINHVGTDSHNLDGYSFVTTPTSSGIPTTATPFAVTTAIPTVTYKTTFVPEPPKTSIKQIFGYSQPAVTTVQPAVIAVKQYPDLEISNYNQGQILYKSNDFSSNSGKANVGSESSGYAYEKPTIKFEDGISYTTLTPITVSKYKPQGFGHSQQTIHKVEPVGYEYSTPLPVYEEPFKKVVAYTTGPEVSYAQPTVATYTPQAYSHQTIHKEEAANGYKLSGVAYETPKTVLEYTTRQPATAIQPVAAVQSGYESQEYSHQTIHKVDTSHVHIQTEDNSGYQYNKPAIKFEEAVKTVGYSTPAPSIVSTYKPQEYSQQTLHNDHSSQINPYAQDSSVTGYAYARPAIQFEETPVQYSAPVTSTYKPLKYNVHTVHVNSQSYVPVSSTLLPEVAYQSVSVYENPIIKYAKKVTPVTFVKPAQSYISQTIHKIEGSGYEYKKPVAIQQPKTYVEYSTSQPVYKASVTTYEPQVYSQQTLHKVDTSQINSHSQENSGYHYSKPAVKYEEVPETVYQHSTPAPAVVSTYEPQVYSQQTLHKVDTSQINTHSQENSGYHYSTPAVKYEEVPESVYQYSTPAPAVVSTYEPQVYSQQTLHKVDTSQINTHTQENSGNHYSKPAVKYEEVPETVYQYSTPAPAVVSTYEPHVYSQQTLHKVDTSQTNTHSQENSGYEYLQPVVKYEEVPKTVYQYSTPAPAVVSTYKPQAYSHQTLHTANKVNIEGNSGYQYSKPVIKFEEASKTVYKYSTPAPIETSYKPESYNHQTFHKIETQNNIPISSTPAPKVVYQPAVTVYQNPILKYVQKEITPISYDKPTVYTQEYQPIVQQHKVSHISKPAQYETEQSYEQNYQNNQGYTYEQPEIQTNIHDVKSEKAYSDASAVSHQIIHQSIDKSQYDNNKKVVFVSTTPSTLVYEDHYAEYETPIKTETYKAPEYIPPNNNYQQTYTVSSTSTPIQQQSTFEIQDQYDYSQQYENPAPAQHVSFSTSHIEQPKKTESVHIATLPSTVTSKSYNQVVYQSPEIQVGYNAEEYLPPIVSSVKPTYKPRVYSTTTSREYLPPTESTYAAPDYLPPKVDNTYLAPKVDNTYLPPLTTKTYVQSTTHVPAYKYEETASYKGSEYLPPEGPSIVNFESFGYKNSEYNEGYNSYVGDVQEAVVSYTSSPIPRKHNIVVETSQSNLLGFGTVGPDAGLVKYTSAPNVISTTESYSSPKFVSPYTPEYVEVTSTVVPVRKTKQKLFRVKSTTSTPYVESTTAYHAPEYLPPSDDYVANFETYGQKNIVNPYQEYTASEEFIVSTTKRPKYRKQNIVVQTAKSQQRYTTDAGVVSTTSAPVVLSSENYSLAPEIVSSTYLPLKQELVEITPSQAPARRTKPKVAVVTKLNDFNPLLVRKLGAVCSCQSPVLVLRGRRPNVRTKIQQDYDDYNSDDDDRRGDVSDDEYARLSARIQSPRRKVVTVAPRVTTTFNPIVVPDDSFYQDYEESDNPLKTGEVEIVSSTPVVSTTERVVRIRPRVKAVTVRPTYKTILLEENVTPAAIVDSQSFDRYGPGGLRSRDETLQGSVDCKRAGLFRHPKQCNKFYACRWDCTKQRFTLHVFNCPVQLSFDPNIGACNWPSQGPSCQGDTLLTNAL